MLDTETALMPAQKKGDVLNIHHISAPPCLVLRPPPDHAALRVMHIVHNFVVGEATQHNKQRIPILLSLDRIVDLPRLYRINRLLPGLV